MMSAKKQTEILFVTGFTQFRFAQEPQQLLLVRLKGFELMFNLFVTLLNIKTLNNRY